MGAEKRAFFANTNQALQTRRWRGREGRAGETSLAPTGFDEEEERELQQKQVHASVFSFLLGELGGKGVDYSP